MAETVGTLDLKIARFERQMQVIEQQLALARMYPNHGQKLILKGSRIQSNLDQLLRQRRNLKVSQNQAHMSGYIPTTKGDYGNPDIHNLV